MKVYTYYYGANRDRGIGIQALSRELDDVITKNMLDNLAGLHTADIQDRDNGALMYLLKCDEKSILGLSYTELPSGSGYNRAAPCSIQYVFDSDEMDFEQIGRTVNFVVFKKPDSTQPTPMGEIPVNESGYLFHNKPAVLANIIDALTKVTLSDDGPIVLIALPQTKNSDYTSARYAISEALTCIPRELRSKISFFTGLPVNGESTDVLAAFDVAAQYKANVVFCSADSFQKLRGHRSFVAVDMDKPVQAGSFASLVAYAADSTGTLKLVEQTLKGKLSYDALNAAAQKVANGEAVSIEKLNDTIRKRDKEYAKLEEEYDKISKKYTDLDRKYDDLSHRHERLKNAYEEKKEGGQHGGQSSKWILIAAIALVAGLLVGGLVAHFIFPNDGNADNHPSQPDAAATPTVMVMPSGSEQEEMQTPIPEEVTATPEPTEEAPEIQNSSTEAMEQDEGTALEENKEPDGETKETQNTAVHDEPEAVAEETDKTDEAPNDQSGDDASGTDEVAAGVRDEDGIVGEPTDGTEPAESEAIVDNKDVGLIVLTTLESEKIAKLFGDAADPYEVRQIDALEGDDDAAKVAAFIENNSDALIVLFLEKGADEELIKAEYAGRVLVYTYETDPEDESAYIICANGEPISSMNEELACLLKETIGAAEAETELEE